MIFRPDWIGCQIAAPLLGSGSTTSKVAVLLIDSDLGFIFWLGQELDRAGFDAFPARSVSAAVELQQKLQLSVDLVIANNSVPGLHFFISELRQLRPHLKVVLVLERLHDLASVAADEWRLKPAGAYADPQDEWVQTVRRVLLEVPLPVNR